MPRSIPPPSAARLPGQRRLPPLNALRAFEAAGRHLSFTLAAEELCVTLSAVSHQIRQLEESLGVAVFHRTGRGLRLTEDGAAILDGISDGFDRMAAAIARLDARQRQGVITVSMLSTFAMRWFIPRLPRFQAAYPDIDIRISTALRPVDLEREGVDCAIRFGQGAWPGLHATRLFGERLTPVCAPSLLRGPHPLASPADLAHHRLLHSQNRADDWRVWLHSAGMLDQVDPTAGPMFETRSFAIQAAIEGLGVAIMDPPLVAEEVAAGRLVQPFAMTIPLSGAYFFVCPEAQTDVPRLAAFRTWLVQEAGG